MVFKGTVCDWQNVNKGTTQGSVSGPHLFNIFINDLTIRDNPCTSVVKYADDTILLCAVMNSSFDYSIDMVEQYMNWSKNNYMPCNVKKCKELIFRKKKCTDVFALIITSSRLILSSCWELLSKAIAGLMNM